MWTSRHVALVCTHGEAIGRRCGCWEEMDERLAEVRAWRWESVKPDLSYMSGFFFHRLGGQGV